MHSRYPKIMKENDTNWEALYRENDTGWDLGEISPPIKAYIDQLSDRSIAILIPGGGNSYEAEYLLSQGFANTTVVDIAPSPLKNIKKRIPHFPKDQLINRDFFEHTGQYDLVFEQTFFCAIHPSQRLDYAQQIHSLLKPSGKLVGLLFDFPFDDDGPPFGGERDLYHPLFSTHFDIRKMEPCHNSIAKRQDRELFITLQRKSKTELRS